MNPLECVLPPIIVHGNWYAARRSAFADALKQTSGEFAGIDITPERHKLVREHFRGLQKTVSIHLLSPTENELRARLSERNWKAEELELRIRDSGRFDQWARQEGGMFFLSPNTKDTIFEACLRLIETTNPV
jgi:guanylate kinase